MLPSKIHHNGPTASIFLYWVGWLYFKVLGWTVTEPMPTHITKGVIIAAPHTSNWDFPHMMASAWLYRMKLSWLGKHTLFTGPFGWFFKALGGIPVDRSAPNGLVGQVADALHNTERLIVAVPPSGTRAYRDHWKSGFYWIALEAKVPILMSYLDFKTKTSNISGVLEPTGDIHADMDAIRAFYAGREGKYPEKQNPIRLKDESPEVGAPAAR